jgi:hypothetical protein
MCLMCAGVIHKLNEGVLRFTPCKHLINACLAVIQTLRGFYHSARFSYSSKELGETQDNEKR